MAISPIGAIGTEAAGASAGAKPTQLAQASGAGSSSSMQSGNTAPAAIVSEPQVSNGGAFPGFTDNLANGVFNEIDKISSKLPKIDPAEKAPIDEYKASMASGMENTNPTNETPLKDQKMEAVSALSKTFDHAVFMAMVNQVISGVSDTSRTLIRQS